MKKTLIVLFVVVAIIVVAGIASFVVAKKNDGLDYDYIIGELMKEKENSDVLNDLSDEEREMVVDELQKRNIYPDAEECKTEPRQKDGKMDYDYYIDEIIKGNGEVTNGLCGDDLRLLNREIKRQLDLGILYPGEHGDFLKR